MKTKRPLALFSIALAFLLACQSLTSPSVADNTPTPTQEIISQPTVTTVPTEPQPEPTQPLATEITDDYGVPMRLVSEGEFIMGTNLAHTVFLDAYYMDNYEVTNAFYRACVDAGACEPPKELASNSHEDYFNNTEYDDFPVIYVDWFMAKTYCEWRGGQLPTEAQWEKAARGTDERIYPWGNEISCAEANFLQCQNGDTTAVGSYENGVSPYGLYDMGGNVFEWVADWYSETYYQNSASSNPPGPDGGELRVVRGGSWEFFGEGASAVNRSGWDPTYNIKSLGFRCARPA